MFELDDWMGGVDFDWIIGDQPVKVGDTFVVLPIILVANSYSHFYKGLILREVNDGVFERVGFMSIKAVHRSEMTTLQKTQIFGDFIEALPIRTIKII
jgi:hypothetical protein